jgi:hypothetical protein
MVVNCRLASRGQKILSLREKHIFSAISPVFILIKEQPKIERKKSFLRTGIFGTSLELAEVCGGNGRKSLI